MNKEYRGFNIYGASEPFSEILLGRVTHWKPTGSITTNTRRASSRSVTLLNLLNNVMMGTGRDIPLFTLKPVVPVSARMVIDLLAG